jgi:hypothetical protein
MQDASLGRLTELGIDMNLTKPREYRQATGTD